MPTLDKRVSGQHRYTCDRLSSLIDGQLSPRERRRVEHHLERCDYCRAELTSLRQTISLLRQLPAPALPRSFVLPMSVQNQQKSLRRWDMSYGILRTASVAVTILLILFISGDVWLGRSSLSSIQPAPVAETMMAQEQPAALLAQPEAEMQTDILAEPAQAPQAPAAIAAPELAPAAEPLVAEKAVPEGPAMAEPAPLSAQEALPAVRAVGGNPPLPKTSGAHVAPTAPAPMVAMGGGDSAAVQSAPQPETLARTIAQPTVANAQEPSPKQAPEIQAEKAPPAEQPAAVALSPARSEVEPLPPQQIQVVEPQPVIERESGSSLRWAAWGVLRIAALVFFGLLLMLIASLIWVSQKRRF